MISQLYNKVSYTAPISYLINANIVEYDMSKANINILLYKGVISRKDYEYYYNLPKKIREIKIGLLQRDAKVAEALKSGFIGFKKMFFEANNIQDSEVLSIKNDAVFLINKIPSITTFENLTFARKNSYTSFYKLGRLELYYYYDFISGEENLDIKGMSEYNQSLHEKYFMDFLKCIFNSAQLDAITETLSLLKDFHENYVAYKLELGYYREFNAESKYLIKPFPNSYQVFKAEHFNPANIQYINIEFNEFILRELFKIYTNIYFMSK